MSDDEDESRTTWFTVGERNGASLAAQELLLAGSGCTQSGEEGGVLATGVCWAHARRTIAGGGLLLAHACGWGSTGCMGGMWRMCLWTTDFSFGGWVAYTGVQKERVLIGYG